MDLDSITNSVTQIIKSGDRTKLFLGTDSEANKKFTKDTGLSLTPTVELIPSFQLNKQINQGQIFAAPQLSLQDVSSDGEGKALQKKAKITPAQSTLKQTKIPNTVTVELPTSFTKQNAKLDQQIKTNSTLANSVVTPKPVVKSLPIAGPVNTQTATPINLGEAYTQPTNAVDVKETKARTELGKKAATPETVKPVVAAPAVEEKIPSNLNNTSSNLDKLAGIGKFTVQKIGSDAEPFLMDLMPAIPSNVRPNVMGQEVPKAGFNLRHKVTTAKFAIPGAAPIIQVMGLDTTAVELAGLFLSVEREEEFRKTVTHKGARIKIILEQPEGISLTYTGVIIEYMTNITRSSRAYYWFKLLISEYDTLPCKLKDVRANEEAKKLADKIAFPALDKEGASAGPANPFQPVAPRADIPAETMTKEQLAAEVAKFQKAEAAQKKEELVFTPVNANKTVIKNTYPTNAELNKNIQDQLVKAKAATNASLLKDAQNQAAIARSATNSSLTKSILDQLKKDQAFTTK